MAATFGYGKKTFIQGLARVCCRLNKYITKYAPTLQKYLTAAQYNCVTSLTACLTTLCNLINKSNR